MTLAAGDDLQAALHAASPGDTIALEPGVYVGPFTLPRKDGDGWITLRSAGPLPAEGERIDPAAYDLPKLVSPGDGQPALRTDHGARGFRLIGLEFAPVDAAARVRDLVGLGDGSREQHALDAVAERLVLDRVYVHGDADGQLRRGIALNSGDTTIVNSVVTECKGKGYDSQAIAGWNGPGPYLIENNLLEGAGENLMFGGADAWIPNLVPSDVVIRGNLFRKPLRWQYTWRVKTLLELKNARRVEIHGNVLENEFGEPSYSAVQFTVRNQDGRAPWSVVEDVRFTGNVVRHTGSTLNLLGRDDLHWSRQGGRITIAGNMFESAAPGRDDDVAAVNFLKITDMPDVTVEQNTILGPGCGVRTYGPPSHGFTFVENLLVVAGDAVLGDGPVTGSEALDCYFPGARFEGNAIFEHVAAAADSPRRRSQTWPLGPANASS